MNTTQTPTPGNPIEEVHFHEEINGRRNVYILVSRMIVLDSGLRLRIMVASYMEGGYPNICMVPAYLLANGGIFVKLDVSEKVEQELRFKMCEMLAPISVTSFQEIMQRAVPAPAYQWPHATR